MPHLPARYKDQGEDDMAAPKNDTKAKPQKGMMTGKKEPVKKAPASPSMKPDTTKQAAAAKPKK